MKRIIALALLAVSAYSHCNLCFYKENPAGKTAEQLATIPSFCQGYENGASLSNTLDTIPSDTVNAFKYYTLKSGHVELFCECDVTAHGLTGNHGKKDTHHLEAQNSITPHSVGFCARSVTFACSSEVDESLVPATPTTPTTPTTPSKPDMPGMDHSNHH